MREKWLQITIRPFNKIYEVSNLGRVRSVDRYDYMHRNKCKRFLKGQVLKPAKNKHGYLTVALSYKGEKLRRQVHRLVAMAFIPNPEDKPEVNHKNLNKEDCAISNLEWVTTEENRQHALRAGAWNPANWRSKKIYLIDKFNRPVKSFKSISEAARKLNLKDSNISKVCKGERSHTGGYRFCYYS